MEIIMKRKADKPISVFTVIGGAILIYMVAILLIACIKKHNKGIVVENIASEWECTIDGKKLDKKVSLKHRFTGLEVGSHIIFTKKCKEIKGIKYPALLCDFMFCNAKVFYDDELLYTYRYNKGIAAKKEATVRLEDYKKGKEFRIELKVANPRRKIYMGEAKLIEEIEEKGYRLRHNFYSVVLGGMLFVFGLLAMGIMGSL